MSATGERAQTQRIKVWDGATRLFHWALVLLFGFSWLSAEKSWTSWHLYSGCAIGALLLFRLAWGFVGSETARFTHFLASPLTALRTMLRLARREPDTQPGHNAAGGWMVLVMLGLLVAQVLTGLAANNDIEFAGPLAPWLGKDWSDTLTKWHFRIFTLLEITVLAHLAAIVIYLLVKRQNLLHPMLHGHKHLPHDTAPPRMAHPARAGVIFLAAAGFMAWVAFGL